MSIETNKHHITVMQRPGDWMAYLDGDKDKWECGQTAGEAVTRLLSARGLQGSDCSVSVVFEDAAMSAVSITDMAAQIDHLTQQNERLLGDLKVYVAMLRQAFIQPGFSETELGRKLVQMAFDTDTALSPILHVKGGWWDWTEADALDAANRGDISEGHLSYILGKHRIECRVLAEKRAIATGGDSYNNIVENGKRVYGDE